MSLPAPFLPLLEKLSEQDAKHLTHALRDAFIARDADIRTTGPAKALHALAEALESDNWQRLRDKLKRNAFMQTLMHTYGLSEAYADAAYLTLGGERESDVTGDVLANQYATRFNIAPVVSAPAPMPAKAPVRFHNPKCAKQAETMLASLLADITDPELDSDEAVGDVVDARIYGSGVTQEVILVLSSSTTLYVTMDNQTDEPIKATIMSRGFGTSAARVLNEHEFDTLMPLLQDAVSSALTNTAGDDL